VGIAQDRRSGATELAVRAAAALAAWLRRTPDLGAELLPQLAEAARLMVQAQPAMASLVTVANTCLWIATEVGHSEAVAAHAEALVEALRQRTQRVADHALRVLPPGQAVMTISHSAIVEEVLCRLNAPVICLESRPGLEGRDLARSLSARDLSVTVAVDAAAASLLKRVGCVVVGADAVDREGIINKVGTCGLALAARAWRVPFYVVCGSEKLVPPGWRIHIEPWPRQSIWPDAPEGIAVEALAFDRTPLRTVTALVMEEGAFRPFQVRRRLNALRLHPALAPAMIIP